MSVDQIDIAKVLPKASLDGESDVVVVAKVLPKVALDSEPNVAVVAKVLISVVVTELSGQTPVMIIVN